MEKRENIVTNSDMSGKCTCVILSHLIYYRHTMQRKTCKM